MRHRSNQYRVQGTQRHALPTLYSYWLGEPASTCTPRFLAECAQSVDDRLRAQAARHPNIATRWLRRLAKDPHYAVRCAVAENPHVSDSTLIRLAHDSLPCVQYAVANSEHLSIPAITWLSRNKTAAIRRLIAQHPHTPPPTLAHIISHDDNQYNVYCALKHPQCPPTALESVLEDPLFYSGYAHAVCTNPNATTKLLQQINIITLDLALLIANHPHCGANRLHELSISITPFIRLAVAQHSNTTVDTLIEMGNDQNGAVLCAVANNPHTPIALQTMISLAS